MSLIPGPIRRAVERLQDPIVSRLIAARVTPNVITTVGTGVLVGAGVAFAQGSARVGAGLLLLSGLFDMLDGRVARETDAATPFGAFYDSTLDRVGEAAVFIGIAVYFEMGGLSPGWRIWGLLAAVVALSAGLLVSYTRARAEGLGLECKVGVAQRAERILLLGIPTLFVGAGPDGLLLFGLVSAIALLSVVTVIQRIHHVHKQTRRPRRRTEARRVPELAETPRERT